MTADHFMATHAKPSLQLLSPNIVLSLTGVGTRNVTHPQGGTQIRVYFKIHFDKHPSALTVMEGYLCEVADCGQVLCFSMLWGKERKITFFPGRKGCGEKREREGRKLIPGLNVCHRNTSWGNPDSMDFSGEKNGISPICPPFPLPQSPPQYSKKTSGGGIGNSACFVIGDELRCFLHPSSLTVENVYFSEWSEHPKARVKG